MANFVASEQWNLDQIDLSFYIDYVVERKLETGGSFRVGSVTYPDHFRVLGDDGTDNWRLDFYGYNLAVNSAGAITAGEVRAVGEFNLDTNAQRWFLDGIVVNAVGAYNAIVSEDPGDEIAILQTAFSGNDTINLSPFADVMAGYAGDDQIKGFGGDDALDGGFGQDTAYYDAAFASCVITFEGATLVIATPNEGTDRLTNFEFVSFAGEVRSVASLNQVNDAPVAQPATASATEDGPLVTGQLVASDPDGDPLTFSPVLTAGFAPGPAGLAIFADGSYTFDPSDPAYQGLAQGQVQELLAGYFVSDGILTDSSTLTITITGVNDAPVLEPSPGVIAAVSGTATAFSARANDIDGDALGYSASAAAHGTVTGAGDGAFSYISDPGYLGGDTITVTVSDGHGGTAQQSYTLTVSAPPADTWRLFASDGNASEIGGSGQVFGTGGFQEITVLDVAGSIAFDPSFNRGGDVVRLAGEASAWQVIRSGSSAVFCDGDTFVQIPVGSAGTAIAFDDGVRLLRYDAGEASLKIGSQPFSGEQVQVTAPEDQTPLPAGADPGAPARLFLGSGAHVAAGGTLAVFGTAGDEQVTLTSGEVSFDPSFNRGGDTLLIDQPASDFLASRTGSLVFLDGNLLDVRIPVGMSGLTLSFFGHDDRAMLYDAAVGSIVIGAQPIDMIPSALVALG